MMREVLLKTKRDFNIVEVKNGREAMDFLKKAENEEALPCLIILDINMPVMDGKETLAAIKSNRKYDPIPVVMFSTSESEIDRLFCQRFGTEMVTKPPTFNSLGIALDKLLKYCI